MRKTPDFGGHLGFWAIRKMLKINIWVPMKCLQLEAILEVIKVAFHHIFDGLMGFIMKYLIFGGGHFEKMTPATRLQWIYKQKDI